MKIAIFGDIHGYIGVSDIPTIDVVVQLINHTEASIVLQVGDMCGYRHFSKPVYWIYGNNDSLTLMEENKQNISSIENLNNIKTGDVVTLSSKDEKIRVSGLNGAYDPIYYYYKREQLSDLGFFVESDIEKCLTLEDIDIFLAHGCPSGLGFGREPDHGVPALRKILEAVRPRFMFCGHAHFYHKVEYSGSVIYALDLANKEYYVLDTATDKLDVIKVDPELFT